MKQRDRLPGKYNKSRELTYYDQGDEMKSERRWSLEGGNDMQMK